VYDIFLLPPAQKDLDDLEPQAFGRILKKLKALSQEPRPPGCLKLTGEDGCRLRIGGHRVLYRIDDKTKRIFVYRIKPRKDAYS
jgi:mRNA interferase RelE/StbE